MQFKVKLKKDRIQDWGKVAERKRKDNLKNSITLWHGELVNNVLVGIRTGKVGRVPGTKVQYIQSREGEAPATRTGDLRTSYRFEVPNDKEAVIGSHLDYALFLEKGTKYMNPRPHLSKAYYNKERQIRERLNESWE